MGIRFACHVCDHPLNIKRGLAGRVGICPKCHGRFRIPLADTAKSLPLENGEVETAASPSQPSESEPSIAGGDDAEPPVIAQEAQADDVQQLSHSPLDDPDAQWYVRPPAGGQYGPASGEVIRSWIGENRITPSTLIWRQGWSQWRSVRDALPEMEFPQAASSLATPPDSPDGTDPVILFGQPEIGHVRSTRSQRRRTMIIVLLVTSLCLVGLLVFIALR